MLSSKLSFASGDTSVQAVLAKLASAMGGIDSLKNIRTISMKGKLTFATIGGTFDIIQDWPGCRNRDSIELPTIQEKDGFNGTKAWSIESLNHNGQLTVNTDAASIAESNVSARFNAFDFLIHPEQYRFEMAQKPGALVVTVTDLRNAKAAFGKTIIEIDKQTYLPTKITTFEDDGTQVVVINESFLTYDGLLFPKKFSRTPFWGSNTLIFDVESITNVPGGPETFDPPAVPRDFTFLSGTKGQAPIKIVEGHIFTTVTMNGIPFTFIVDTGDAESTLGSDLVKELGLSAGGSVSANGVSGLQAGGFVSAPEMRVGNVMLHSQNIMTTDLSFLDTKLPHVDGILGADFFHRFVVRLDYVGGTMDLFDPATFKYTGTGQRFPLDGESFTLSVDGISGSFSIDTGSGSIDLFSSYFEKTPLMKNKSEMPSVAYRAGFGSSDLPTYLTRCHSISVGKYTLKDVPVELAEATQGAFANTNAAGNIGYPFWRRFTTYFNFSHGEMILEPNEAFGLPFDMNRAGMGVSKVNSQWIVDAVVTQSPAAELGLEKGDVPLDIDGKALAGMLIADVPDIFKQPAGTMLKIQYSRGNVKKTATIVLRDYIKYYDAY